MKTYSEIKVLYPKPLLKIKIFLDAKLGFYLLQELKKSLCINRVKKAVTFFQRSRAVFCFKS